MRSSVSNKRFHGKAADAKRKKTSKQGTGKKKRA
jgi:hypothetical protein